MLAFIVTLIYKITTEHNRVCVCVRAYEYKIPLCFAFVNYEKALDSIEFNPLFESLENEGVEAAYITLIRDLYNGATSTLKLHKDSDKIKLQRGVKQGDNI